VLRVFGAEGALAFSAKLAASTWDMMMCEYPVTDDEPFDTTTQSGHFPDLFVPHYARSDTMSVDLLDVRTADAAAPQLDQHLPFGGFRLWDIGYPQLAWCFDQGRLQVITTLSPPRPS